MSKGPQPRFGLGRSGVIHLVACSRSRIGRVAKHYGLDWGFRADREAAATAFRAPTRGGLEGLVWGRLFVPAAGLAYHSVLAPKSM